MKKFILFIGFMFVFVLGYSQYDDVYYRQKNDTIKKDTTVYIENNSTNLYLNPPLFYWSYRYSPWYYNQYYYNRLRSPWYYENYGWNGFIWDKGWKHRKYYYGARHYNINPPPHQNRFVPPPTHKKYVMPKYVGPNNRIKLLDNDPRKIDRNRYDRPKQQNNYQRPQNRMSTPRPPQNRGTNHRR